MIKSIITNRKELSQPSLPVEKGEDITSLIQDLKDTLETKRGYALAAPQIGVKKQVAYCKIPLGNGQFTEFVLINPVIVSKEHKVVFEKEGCLSFPNLRVDTGRFYYCTIETLNEKFETRKYVLQDLEAFVIQHEVDHLRGLLIFDRKWRKR